MKGMYKAVGSIHEPWVYLKILVYKIARAPIHGKCKSDKHNNFLLYLLSYLVRFLKLCDFLVYLVSFIVCNTFSYATC